MTNENNQFLTGVGLGLSVATMAAYIVVALTMDGLSGLIATYVLTAIAFVCAGIAITVWRTR